MAEIGKPCGLAIHPFPLNPTPPPEPEQFDDPSGIQFPISNRYG